MRRTTAWICAAAALVGATSADAADKVKVAIMTTLSGPGAALGTDIRDAMQLYVKKSGGKLGGLPAEVSVTDDQLNADVGRQAVEKFVLRDRPDFVTGI